jgi:hypothetical protein
MIIHGSLVSPFTHKNKPAIAPKKTMHKSAAATAPAISFFTFNFSLPIFPPNDSDKTISHYHEKSYIKFLTHPKKHTDAVCTAIENAGQNLQIEQHELFVPWFGRRERFFNFH